MMSAPSIADCDEGAGGDRQSGARQVAHRLCRRQRIDIVEPDVIDAADSLHGKRLKFCLRAVADHRHGARTLRCQMPCRHGRGGGGAKRCQQRHFSQQYRIAGRDFRQEAKGGDGLQALRHVLRMAVHIFEAIDLAIRGRHQLDHALARNGRRPAVSCRRAPSGGNPSR